MSGRRIADINIRERILPAQPPVELGDRSEIECAAVLPGIAEVGVEEHVLRDDCALPGLVRKGITQRQARLLE